MDVLWCTAKKAIKLSYRYKSLFRLKIFQNSDLLNYSQYSAQKCLGKTYQVGTFRLWWNSVRSSTTLPRCRLMLAASSHVSSPAKLQITNGAMPCSLIAHPWYNALVSTCRPTIPGFCLLGPILGHRPPLLLILKSMQSDLWTVMSDSL